MPLLIYVMALGTAALDAALSTGLVMLVKPLWRKKVAVLIHPNALNFIFLISAGGVVGALILQYADSLAPCSLCWWQRVFMVPVAIISGIAVAKKKKVADIADYILALSIPGAAVALYQHVLQMVPQGALPAPCDASGDCAARSVFELGFVTLPWMAFTLFAALIFMAFLVRKGK